MITFQQFIERQEESLAKIHEKPGGSNVGEKRKTSGAKQGPFCGPSGNAPAGSYPVTSPGQARAAKAYAHNAPDPEGIKKCVDRIEK
jgi:hypothetical protein